MSTSARKLFSVVLLVILCAALPSATALAATRGDANADGILSVLDVFYIINHVFSSGNPSSPPCLADANNDSQVTASDPLFLLNHLFASGPAPAGGCDLDSSAIYVSAFDAAAFDNAGCGLGPVGTGATHYPCRTITQGISRASAESRPRVNVAEGTYGESITLASGVSLYGGFDNSTWGRNLQNNITQVNGGNRAIQGTNIANLTIDGLSVQSSAAAGTGESSFGIVLANAQQIQILNNRINSGTGAAGNAGTSGTTGANGGLGGQGNPGCEDSSVLCSGCNRPAGGTGGSSAAGRPGGFGGQPGWSTGGGSPGLTGSGGTPGGAGATCGGDRFCDGQVGGNGAIGTNGNNGQGGASFGSFSGTTYIAASGTGGTNGGAGNGGGGGGGGGGGDDNCDSYGSSGGGGGGGGAGGGGGLAGSGGGGSFGIVLLDTTGTIMGNSIVTGTGGNGGRGGTGGLYGSGGAGGSGGPYGGSGEQDDGGDGASGGTGGRGGFGGDGGGGGGGPSIGIVLLGSPTVSLISNNITPGAGGSGGVSAAPGATGLSAPTR